MEFNVIEPEYTKKSKVSTTNTTNQSFGIIDWFKHHFKSKADNPLQKEQMHDPDPVLIEISTDGGMNQHAKSPTEKVSRSEAMSDSDTSTVDVRDIESNIQFYDQTIQVYDTTIKLMDELLIPCSHLMDTTLSELVHQYLNNESEVHFEIDKDATSDSSDNEAMIHTHTAGQKRINSLLLLASAPIQAPILSNREKYKVIECRFHVHIDKESNKIVWKGNKRLQTNYQQADEEIDTDIEALDYGKEMCTKNVLVAYQMMRGKSWSTKARCDYYYKTVKDLAQFFKK